jgi:hypothetical protein
LILNTNNLDFVHNSDDYKKICHFFYGNGVGSVTENGKNSKQSKSETNIDGDVTQKKGEKENEGIEHEIGKDKIIVGMITLINQFYNDKSDCQVKSKTDN